MVDWSLVLILFGLLLFVLVNTLRDRSTPELTKLVPASGSIWDGFLHVTIYGTGFAPTGNVVEFGPEEITAVASVDGQSIAFGVSTVLGVTKGEMPMRLQGDFPVTVKTWAGTSNALIFTLK